MHTSLKKTGFLNGCRLRQLPWLIAGALALTPWPALAQSQEEDNGPADVIEEVTVTAQRREQSLQEVPMAVSAFTGAELEALQADNLESLNGAVPNMNLVQGRGSNSSINAFIRGVGQPDALQTFDPAVGIYVDDVYMSRIQGSLFKVYDVERIEVLRGPQGTLYGKNTPGGAIRLITRTPGQDFEAQAGLLLGNYNRIQAKAYVAGPVSDNFAMSFSVLHDEDNGYVTDPTKHNKYNNENTTIARFKAKWDASDSVDVILALDYTQEDTRLTLGRQEAPLIGIDLGTGPFVLQPAPTGDWNYETSPSLPYQDGQKLKHYGGSLTVDWDIDSALTFRSITAYRSLTPDLYIDIDATQWQLGDVFVGIDQDQFTQEFQLLGNTDTLHWVAGLYYLDEDIPSHQEAYADDFLYYYGIPISFLRTIDDKLKTKSYAAYGQVDWSFTDRWTLGVGMRYTKDDKDYWRTTSTFSDLLGTADPAFEFSDSDSWDKWTPTVTLDYEMNDEVHFYGRAAEGFKSGGFNGRANLPSDVSSFDPETVKSIEVGAKTLMADGRLAANYAVFWSKYEDFQARVSVGEGVDASLPVLNAAELDIKGAELELTWYPLDALQLSTQVGYLDSKYGKGGFSGADGVPDEPAFSPKWTVRLAGMYTFALSGGASLNLGAVANYRDSMWLGVDNLDTLYQSSYWVLDGLASWVSPDQRWTIMAGIKNAADEVYKVEGQEFRSVANIQTAYYGLPRMYTLSVEYKY